MIIKTKLNIGDTFFFVEDGKVIESRVWFITATVYSEGNIERSYFPIECTTNSISLKDSEVFKKRVEAENSLIEM